MDYVDCDVCGGTDMVFYNIANEFAEVDVSDFLTIDTSCSDNNNKVKVETRDSSKLGYY